MSRIPSSTSVSSSGTGGVVMSGQPLSTVYTVFVIIGTLFLVAALVVTMTKSNELFGFVMPLGDDYKVAKDKTTADAKAVKTAADAVNAPFDLLTGMSGHTEAGGAAQPAATPVVPAAPVAPVAPATPAPASAAAPAPPAA